MHNKKLKGSIAVLALSAVLIGGTFAWLGSTDKVTNIFKTTQHNAETMDGVDIYEKFTQESEAKPGTAVEKIVQVKNTAKYNSLIRVQMNAEFVENKITVDNSKIVLNEANIIEEKELVVENGIVTRGLNKWVKVTENAQTYYYYIGNVAPDGFTTKILDSVTLDASVAGNPNYINQKFNVDIDAYSVQSTAEAVTSKDSGEKDFGATGAQNGFGLNETNHQNLVAALQAVANGNAGTSPTVIGVKPTPQP